MSFSELAATGRKRAHSLDLQDIASAIRNLPADASASLPSPVPASVPPLAKKTKQGPAQTDSAASTADETRPVADSAMSSSSVPSSSSSPPALTAAAPAVQSASDTVFQRALALAVQTGTRRMKHDQSLGRYGRRAEETAVLLRRLDRERTARQTRTVDALDAAGRVSVDGESVQILAQSLANSARLASPPDGPPPALPPSYIACHDGTVWLWTKYYKGVWGHTADQQVALRPPGPPPASVADTATATTTATPTATATPTRPATVAFDLISSVASCPELVLQVCCSLRLRDILVLYRVSRVFKRTLDANLGANVLYLARRLVAPDTLAVFPWRLYRCTTRPMPTPAGVQPTLRYLGLLVSRERKVRDILACLARAGHRLPRPTAAGTLKKMWLLLDVATNRGRLALLRNEALFTDADLLNMVMFHVKLVLHFHEPLYGPNHRLPPGAVPPPPPPPPPTPNTTAGTATAAQDMWRRVAGQPSHPLVETLLGQRGGLHVLWALLRNKQYRTAREVIELKVRYDYLPPPDALSGPGAGGQGSRESTVSTTGNPGHGVGSGDGNDNDGQPATTPPLPPHPPSVPVDINDYPPGNSTATDTTPPGALHDTIHTVPLWEMGVGHLEGWGLGTEHLLRPDELAPLEAERRRRGDPANHLDLRRHIPLMAVWGCRDFSTGENLVPTLEEMYMTDDDTDVDDAAADRKKAREASKSPLAALFLSSLDASAAPTAEQRLARRCGNVPFRPGEWKPWQVLKKQWDTLPLQDRLDIWWINHQQRLKNQAWGKDALEMHEAEQGRTGAREPQVAVADHAHGDDGGDEKPLPYEYDVCKETLWLGDDSGDDGDPGHDDQDHPESPGGSPPWYSVGSSSGSGGSASHVPSSTFSTASTAVHSGFYGDSAGLSSSRATSGVSMASSTAAFSAVPSLSVARTPSSSSTYAASSSYATLPRRDQRLVTASVRSALRAHDAVDAALVAQADEAYDEYDLVLWEQTLAATGNDLLSEAESGTDDDDDDDDDDDKGGINGTDGNDDDSSDINSNASVDTAAAAPRLLLPTTHSVLAPAYGGGDDALQLLRRLQKAEAGLAAAETWLREETAAAAAAAQALDLSQAQAKPTPVMTAAIRERTRRKDEREWLQKKLERQITAEVFAMSY